MTKWDHDRMLHFLAEVEERAGRLVLATESGDAGFLDSREFELEVRDLDRTLKAIKALVRRSRRTKA